MHATAALPPLATPCMRSRKMHATAMLLPFATPCVQSQRAHVTAMLTPLQRQVYQFYVENVASQKLFEADRKSRGEKSSGSAGTSTLGCILALKKLCNHPKLVYDAMNGYDQDAKASSAAFKDCEHMFPEAFSSSRGNRAAGLAKQVRSAGRARAGEGLRLRGRHEH